MRSDQRVVVMAEGAWWRAMGGGSGVLDFQLRQIYEEDDRNKSRKEEEYGRDNENNENRGNKRKGEKKRGKYRIPFLTCSDIKIDTGQDERRMRPARPRPRRYWRG